MCDHECCPPVERPHSNPATVEERLDDHDWKIQNQFDEVQGLHKFVMGLAAQLYAVEDMAKAMPEGEAFLAEYNRVRP